MISFLVKDPFKMTLRLFCIQLWEASQAENAQLRLEMAEVRVELEDTRRRLREALLVSLLLDSTVQCSAIVQYSVLDSVG